MLRHKREEKEKIIIFEPENKKFLKIVPNMNKKKFLYNVKEEEGKKFASKNLTSKLLKVLKKKF